MRVCVNDTSHLFTSILRADCTDKSTGKQYVIGAVVSPMTFSIRLDKERIFISLVICLLEVLFLSQALTGSDTDGAAEGNEHNDLLKGNFFFFPSKNS